MWLVPWWAPMLDLVLVLELVTVLGHVSVRSMALPLGPQSGSVWEVPSAIQMVVSLAGVLGQ